jgi:quercetin dioxygenase-like cupin family protein
VRPGRSSSSPIWQPDAPTTSTAPSGRSFGCRGGICARVASRCAGAYDGPVRELILAPGEGLSVENPMGGLFTFKITSDESDGALTAIETFIVRQEGPPLHVHDQDEVIYTLAGSLRVKLSDTLREAPAGSFVFIPRGTPHTWQNVGTEPLRFFATIMPAAVAFEEFFKRYAQLAVEERGVEAFARLATETQAFEVVGPPLAESDPL